MVNWAFGTSHYKAHHAVFISLRATVFHPKRRAGSPLTHHTVDLSQTYVRPENDWQRKLPTGNTRFRGTSQCPLWAGASLKDCSCQPNLTKPCDYGYHRKFGSDRPRNLHWPTQWSACDIALQTLRQKLAAFGPLRALDQLGVETLFLFLRLCENNVIQVAGTYRK